jgi:hypothetical protein
MGWVCPYTSTTEWTITRWKGHLCWKKVVIEGTYEYLDLFEFSKRLVLIKENMAINMYIVQSKTSSNDSNNFINICMHWINTHEHNYYFSPYTTTTIIGFLRDLVGTLKVDSRTQILAGFYLVHHLCLYFYVESLSYFSKRKVSPFFAFIWCTSCWNSR